MTHLFVEEGEGTSEKSLTEAVAAAIQSCLCEYNGDHPKSITVLIDGYSFDGKNFRVKVKVVFIDHELAHEDYYHEVEKEREERERLSHDMADQLYGAVYGFQGHRDQTGDQIKEALEGMDNGTQENGYNFDYDENTLAVYADDQTQEQIGREWAVTSPAHENAPALGLGTTGGSGEDKSKAA